MALSVALPPSGLETETFSSFSAFGLRDILGISHTSPTPSISSDSCSIGSLGSLKSESNGASVPTSPQGGEKKLVLPSSPETELKVMYRGRNILDLGKNMEGKGWNMRAAFLPDRNMWEFFANRSQYHRLSGYDKDTDHPMARCELCDFAYIVE